jgi:hypothetical protein
MTYKCPQGQCNHNVPADTGGCVCAMPEHVQRQLISIKEMADWRELQRIGSLVEAEMAFELSKQFPDPARVARIEKLAGVPLR